MGNLYAESAIRSNILERLCIKRYAENGVTYTDETYTNAVDNGSISRSEFINPLGKHYGYGLAQWTTSSRKANLYDYCKSQKTSIGDIKMQCEYLLAELQTVFKTVFETLMTATDINTASDVVLLRFEAPAQAESQKLKRREYSKEVLNLYGKGGNMVIIGSARIDENGKAYGGKAGDQTGSEVCIQEYYDHPKVWRTIRAIDPVARENIAMNMEWACANDNIGYDQNENTSLYKVVKPLNYNCSKVTTKCEADCGRLVRVCVLYAGIPVEDFYTGDEVEKLLATKAFKEVKVKLPEGLLRGDILVTKTKGHTVVALTNGDGSVTKPVVNEPTPAAGKYTVGWHQDNIGWWYADTVNTYVKNHWRDINGHRYYFDNSGYAVKGWQMIDGKKYFFEDESGNRYECALYVTNQDGVQSVGCF